MTDNGCFNRTRSIYLYERSTCRYIKLIALNVLHVHGPRFNAPNLFSDIKRSIVMIFFIDYASICFHHGEQHGELPPWDEIHHGLKTRASTRRGGTPTLGWNSPNSTLLVVIYQMPNETARKDSRARWISILNSKMYQILLSFSGVFPPPPNYFFLTPLHETTISFI